MSKTPMAGNLRQLTLRLTEDQLAFATHSGAGNSNVNLRAIVEDARTLYGLPSLIVERLVAEYAGSKPLDLSRYDDRRELIIRVFTEHYTKLIEKSHPDDE